MAIDGDWYNEFGSRMRLRPDAEGGLSGEYVSAVGHVAGTYRLIGRYAGSTEAGHGIVLGWTIAWHNDRGSADSVTSWSGQYLAQDPERILTTWLLSRSAEPDEVWEATVVGQDVFTRRPPTDEEVERSLRSGRPVPHPKAP
ncbi:avidin family protein [Saccharomonospora marina XMU15]|uniref:Avidin family protein n=1 Tax=Saccharomonospora marina XMU15 TaxID=882083 RepID=H5X4Q0_9PSEU|nr:avidin/streptavidin family protein [Saccharomonospora marina]EHR51126.1 avidin family protein [Saccharomonospora marina XMU15]